MSTSTSFRSRSINAGSYSSKEKLTATLLVGLMFGTPLVGLPRKAFAQEAGEAAETFSFSDASASSAVPAQKAAAKSAMKAKSAPVSNRGTFGTSVSIQLPPGRLGMTPGLSLSYDSGGFRTEGPVGAGWSFGVGKITRSTRMGFPLLKREAGVPQYDDDRAQFTGPSGEMQQYSDARHQGLTRTYTDGELYVPVRAVDNTVYEYSVASNAWVQHRTDGSKAFFGLEASGETGRVVNELGTQSWLLVMEKDINGNHISYSYHHASEETRTNKLTPQSAPILKSATWGGNLDTGLAHAFKLVTSIAAVSPETSNRIDFMNGGVRHTHVVQELAVCGPKQAFSSHATNEDIAFYDPACDSGQAHYWSYELQYQDSPDTGRKLLSSVEWNPADPRDDSDVYTYAYSENSHLASWDGAPIELTNGAYARYPHSPSHMTSDYRAMVNPRTSSASKFVDLDGDGLTDTAYLGAGMSVPSNPIVLEADILGGAWKRTFRFEDIEDFASNPSAAASPYDPTTNGMRSSSFMTNLADMDADGVVDAVHLQAFYTDQPALSRTGNSPCYSDSFWQTCGVVDPLGAGLLCQFSTVCDEFDSLDLSMCTGNTCYVTESQLLADFSHLGDWVSNPPFTPSGDALVTSLGGETYATAQLVGFPHSTVVSAYGFDQTMTEQEATDTLAAIKAATTNADLIARCDSLIEACIAGRSWSGAAVPIRIEGSLAFVPYYRISIDRNLHFGDEQNPLEYRLLGWPAAVRKHAAVSEHTSSAQLGTWRASTDSDFQAPIVDLNADGYSDIALLKALGNAGTEREYALTPRVFLHSEREGTSADKWQVDWESFYDTFPSVSTTGAPISAFNQSLNDILIGPGATYVQAADADPIDGQTPRFGDAPIPNPTTLFVDFNSDGLPDFLAADPSSTDEGAHQVFENRGYRFGVPNGSLLPTDAPSWTSPFAKLQKSRGPNDPLTETFALMPAYALTDINADGRTDVVIRWSKLGSAGSEVNLAFLNRGSTFELVSDFHGNLVGLPNVPLAILLTGPPGPSDGRSPALGDVSRFADLNNDGLVDFAVPGVMCTRLEINNGVTLTGSDSGCPDIASGQLFATHISDGNFDLFLRPAKVYLNKGVIPDLLIETETSRGAQTGISYVAATSQEGRGIVTGAYRPPGTMVVSEVRSSAGPVADGFEEDLILLNYDNYVRDPGHEKAIGFETTVATFVNRFASSDVGQMTVTKTFDVQPAVVGVGLRHPLKGTVLESVTSADGWTSREASTFELTKQGVGVLLQSSGQYSEDCLNGIGCKQSGSEVVARDAFGFVTSSRSGRFINGAIVASESVSEQTVTTHRDGPWVLGLPAQTTLWGDKYNIQGSKTSNAQLRKSTSDFSAKGEIEKSIQHDLTPSSCSDVVLDDEHITLYFYNALGMVDGIQSGALGTSYTFGPWALYVQSNKVTTTTYVDGVDVGSTPLESSSVTDLRFGETRVTVGVNGEETETVYDSRGRPRLGFGPYGKLLETVSYNDLYPNLRTVSVSATEATSTSILEGLSVETYVDSQGRVRSAYEGTYSNGTNSDWVMTGFVAHDSWGNTRESFLPKSVSASGEQPLGIDPVVVSDFDSFSRLLAQTTPDGTAAGRVTTYSYAPQLTTTTNPRGFVTASETDWRGLVVTHIRFGDSQTPGAQYDYVYDDAGQLASIRDADGRDRHLEYDGGGRLFRVDLPHPENKDGGYFQICANTDGTTRRTKSPTGAKVDDFRDEAGRSYRTDVQDNNGVTSTFYRSYDSAASNALGRLWRSVSETSTTEMVYDDRGLPSSTSTSFGSLVQQVGSVSGNFITGFDYGLRRELRQVEFSREQSGSTILFGLYDYDYSPRGRLNAVTSELEPTYSPLVYSMTYDAFGQMGSAAFGSKIDATWSRHPQSRDIESIAYDRGGAMLAEAEYYNRDKHGNPEKEVRNSYVWSSSAGGGVGVEISSATTKIHHFDAFDRLTDSSLGIDGNTVVDETYTYSPAGLIQSAGSATYKYTHPTQAQAATAVSGGGISRSLSYEADGTVSYDTGAPHKRTLLFDAAGCLRDVKAVSGPARVEQTCGIDGKMAYRQTTTASGKVSRVLRLGTLVEVRPDDGAKGTIVVRLPVNGTVSIEDARDLASGNRVQEKSGYTLSDMRGSVLAKAELSNGNVVTKAAEYGPWGRQFLAGADEAPVHGFVDEEADRVFGYSTFGRRTYDPTLRRWLSADPLAMGSPESMLGRLGELDVYGYAANNPVRLIDSTGLLAAAVAEVIDERGLKAAEEGRTLDSYGWAFAQTAWAQPGIGAESLSQVAAKGRNASKRDWVLAAIDVISILPFGKLLKPLKSLKSTKGGTKAVALPRAVTPPKSTPLSSQKLLPAPKTRGNPGKTEPRGTFFVDKKGNAIPTPPGGKISGSPDGKFIQGRDKTGALTGTRKDGGHKPAGHPDTRAQKPHGHVPGVSNSDGTPWLPINK